MAEVQKVRVFTNGNKYKTLKLLYRESREHLPTRIFLDDYVQHMLQRLGFFGYVNDKAYIAIEADFWAVRQQYFDCDFGAEEQMLDIALRVQQFGQNAKAREQTFNLLEDKIALITSSASLVLPEIKRWVNLMNSELRVASPERLVQIKRRISQLITSD